MDAPNTHSIVFVLEQIFQSRTASLTLGELLAELKGRGFVLMVMIMVLPNCIPIPILPGMSTIFSLPLLFFTFQMVLGRKEPWLPRMLSDKTLQLSELQRLLRALTPSLNKIQIWIRPRLLWMSSEFSYRIIGLCWFIFSLSIAIPFPMTNFLPGLGILISALGLMGRDGYLIWLGLGVGVLGILLSLLLLLMGNQLLAGFLY